MIVGLLHPGDMGAAIGGALVGAGQEVLWASAGRSPATAERARRAGLQDAGSLDRLVGASELVLSICPPHAALDLARAVAGAGGRPTGWVYLDANAISPATANLVADAVGSAGARYVDGGIIGPPPRRAGTTRLYLSGPHAAEVSGEIATVEAEIHVLGDDPFAASALKLSYAAWTKGSSALILAARMAAGRAGVEDALLEEWRASLPDLASRHDAAARSAAEKGWRWVGEMEEIASMMRSLGLPGGFHQAAADVFRLGPLPD